MFDYKHIWKNRIIGSERTYLNTKVNPACYYLEMNELLQEVNSEGIGGEEFMLAKEVLDE